MKLIATRLALLSWGVVPGIVPPPAQQPVTSDTPAPQSAIDTPKPPVAAPNLHREVPDDPYMPTPPQPPRGQRGRTRWTRGQYVSIQVNVDELGDNIVGDAANEPSIAIDPVNPSRLVIGWRQFDTVQSDFRQGGWAYSHDAGQAWTFPGVLEPEVFRSDPVLDFDADGNFYYYSLDINYACQLFKSMDGGVSWWDSVFAYGGDKAWMTIDRTGGIGRGNIYTYSAWSDSFTRSTDGGETFMSPIPVPLVPSWGTLSVGPDGELYISGSGMEVARSSNAQDPWAAPVFEWSTPVDLGGSLRGSAGPNPGGILGQAWIATDHSVGPNRGNVYLLASVYPIDDPLDVMFSRSTDGGVTWSEPIRINDDPVGNGAWQWFGTMSVAPNGRIDAVWNDTRNDPDGYDSELYYSFSTDAGVTWSPNVPVSRPWDPHVGWPDQDKIGDYYDAISDNSGMSVAYAATFNDEQDVYFLRIPADCNGNGVPDDEDIAAGTSEDCNDNDTPDECEPDCNGNGTADPCEIIDGTSEDCNDNGILDECIDLEDDCNSNQAPDACDIADGPSEDCNENLIPDECEPDFDDDGLIDDCDPDIDNDGVPNEDDVCDFTPLAVPVNADGSSVGDTEPDCDVDLTDYKRFEPCGTSSGPGTPPPLEWCIELFNYDGDDDIDLADFAGFQRVFTGTGE